MNPFLLWIAFVFIALVVYLYWHREKHRKGDKSLSPEVPPQKLPPGGDTPSGNTPENVNFIRGPGEYEFEVVGESHYQKALREICGPRKEEGENKQMVAFLIFEDSNPHDKFAVRVDIDGKTVGYMSREDARSFRQKVKEANIPDNGLYIACYAMIRGGWDRGGGDKGHYGVWLDIPIEG